jgi:hypothetical protein
MPKLTREVNESRESSVFRLLEGRPEASLADLNDALKAEYGHRMNTTRLSALRERFRARIQPGPRTRP